MAAAATLVRGTAAYRDSFQDLRPANDDHGTLHNFISRLLTDKDNLYTAPVAMSSTPSPDVESDNDVPQNKDATCSAASCDKENNCAAEMNQHTSVVVGPPAPLPFLAEFADRAAAEAVFGSIVNADHCHDEDQP